MVDLLLTWPKKRSLDSYLGEVEKAKGLNLNVFFKVPTLPQWFPNRSYMVYDGFIRGWLPVANLTVRSDVKDPITGNRMSGQFIERRPEWHPIPLVPMKGFRSFRYLKDELDGAISA